MKKENVEIFTIPDPIVSAGILVLLFAKRIFKVQRNLTIVKMDAKDSASSQIDYDNTLKKMFSGYKFEFVLIKTASFFNSLAAETLLSIKKKQNLKFKFNMNMYFFDSYFQVQELKKNLKLYTFAKNEFDEKIKQLNLLEYLIYTINIFYRKIKLIINLILYKLKFKIEVCRVVKIKKCRYKFF